MIIIPIDSLIPVSQKTYLYNEFSSDRRVRFPNQIAIRTESRQIILPLAAGPNEADTAAIYRSRSEDITVRLARRA